MSASNSSPNSNDKIQQTVTRIEDGEHKGNPGSSRLLEEVHQLRQADSQNGSLDKCAFKTDLAAVSAQLHKDGVLPNIDLVEAKNGDAAVRGISQPGQTPDGGDPSLVTKSHGTTFTYNDQGEVQSYSKGKDTWTYDNQDGKYHESIDGKATKNTNSDIVSVNGNGTETVTNPDGSSSTTTRWGGTIDRNPDGLMTKETSGQDSKSFEYQNGQLTSMTDQPKGKPAETYTKASDGKFYAASDSDHKNPLDISVEPENTEGKPSNGVVEITDKNGNITDQHWGGTNVQWNNQHQLTEIDYSNGNKATDFKYGSATLDPSGNPLGTPEVTGFTMTGKDGKPHTYTSSDGNISVDGGKPVPGTLTTDANGNLTATETGDGSDAQFKSTRFGLGGAVVESGKFNGQELPEEVTGWGGKTSTYKYDSNGDLTAVDAHGFDLTKDGDKWVTKNGHDTDLTPTIDANGTFSVTRPDGTFDSWSAAGSKIQGIPDTADAIAKEAQEVQSQDGSPTDANGGTNTSKFHAGMSDFYQGIMTIDDDGSGSGHNDGNHQSDTSFEPNGHALNADNTNYVALAPGWAADHNLKLGDLVAVRADGKTAYAIYGDNYEGDAVHTEGSYHLAQQIGTLDGNSPPANSSADVKFYALPDSGSKLDGNYSQANINSVGSEDFGGSTAA